MADQLFMLEDFKIKVFEAVRTNRSFTKAAKALGISQPAVSQNIAELEKILNVKLFERSGAETVLTEQGRIFSEYASHILYWCESAGVVFGPKGRISSGVLRISATQEVADYLLPGMLQKLYASVPGLCAQVFPANASAGFAPDLEIWTSTAQPSLHDSPYLVAELPVVMLASPFNTEARSVQAGDTVFSLPAAVWEPLFPSLGLALSTRVCLRSNSLEIIKKTVEYSRNTVAILPLCAALSELSSVRLVRVDMQKLPGSLHLYSKASDSFRNASLCRIAQTLLLEACK